MSFRWYQEEAIQSVWDFWLSKAEGNPLICLPCGAGKTHVIAGLIQRVLPKVGSKKILVLSPRRELVAQSYEKITSYLPFASVGIVSAGLGRKDFHTQIIVAGIHSVYRRAEEVGYVALLIVDEAQWLPSSGDGMFLTFIRGLQKQNPNLKIVALTATPWRTSTGILVGEGSLFSDIVYDVGVRRLMDEGFLCKLVSKSPRTQADLSGVAVRAGEYVESEMENAFNRHDLIHASITEVEKYAGTRKSWLFFCSGKLHAEAVTKALNERGHSAEFILSDTPSLFRDQYIRAFKAQELKCLVGCQVFTEGFDATNVDMIALFRGTKSKGLYYQMVGRGMRIDPRKENTLVLDFAGVIQEHGPVDRLKVTTRRNPLTGKNESRLESIPAKMCPECRCLVELSAKECTECGFTFPAPTMRLNHTAEASSAPILYQPEFKELEVLRVEYDRHKKRDGDSVTMRVDYVMGEAAGVVIDKISEWVCLEHEGFAQRKAVSWWRMHAEDPTQDDYPDTVAEGLKRVGELKVPKKIRAQKEGKWWRVVKVLEWAKPVDVAAEESDLADEMGTNL